MKCKKGISSRSETGHFYPILYMTCMLIKNSKSKSAKYFH
uniref:Uncharacterized protein n=1 Tax=Arundo donax TaxID=35708 RepID=A0A0A9BFS7_ARUDO